MPPPPSGERQLTCPTSGLAFSFPSRPERASSGWPRVWCRCCRTQHHVFFSDARHAIAGSSCALALE
eukprot:1927614-Alexandrium_andersonii.AAC.1